MLFLGRCKFKHALCFLQYRRMVVSGVGEDLEEIFGERKLFLVNMVQRMGERAKRESDLSQEQWSDEEFKETKLRKKQVTNDKLDCENLIRRLSLDRQNQIHTFTELGLFDPFNHKSTDEAIMTAKSLDFNVDVYPK